MRKAAFTVLLLLPVASAADGREGFYWTATAGTFLSAGYLFFQDSDLAGTAGNIGGSRSRVDGQYDPATDRGWTLAFGHEYNALDIVDETNAPPATNGDLHTLHLAAQWRSPLGPGTLRLAAAPALSVSSNGLTNPRELDSDSLQLWGAALYSLPVNSLDWILGAARDHRFGSGRAYPVAGVAWRGKRLALRAVYPDVSLALGLARRWRLEIDLTPDGNEWLAYDRNLENPDEFQREAWQGRISLAFRFDNGISLGASAGYYWQQEWQFRRHDGSIARLDSDDSGFLGVHLGWYRP